ncbi:MAG TPA: DUF4179 domain-containing protein [Candidatus Scatomonas pullistercoris]|uniref:DUF4179 domain-containing protein n=1 Tax=Candidatus Scatomonas pullistercoris TaxID=2840920 RepID=A0A9D1TAQ3_9FIRM|nr:DUF4179 domain-containing protein [Candidatus Scatomonas pullistercoris]
MLAAVLLSAGTVSVAAAGYAMWSNGMDAVISATNEQKQLLQDNGISSFIGKSSTSNGITVTAGQTIVDNYFAYLTFEVEGYIPEDEYQPDFMDMKIRIDGKEPEASAGRHAIPDLIY